MDFTDNWHENSLRFKIEQLFVKDDKADASVTGAKSIVKTSIPIG